MCPVGVFGRKGFMIFKLGTLDTNIGYSELVFAVFGNLTNEERARRFDASSCTTQTDCAIRCRCC